MRSLVVALMIFSFWNSSLFASTNTKLIDEETYFYCPDHIIRRFNNLLDVQNPGNNNVLSYWGTELTPENYETNKPWPSYNESWDVLYFIFSGAEVPDRIPNSVVCHYRLANKDDPLFDLAVSIKAADYQPYFGEWKHGQCLSQDPKKCPIIEGPNLVIHNADFVKGISVVINRREISQIPSNTYSYITYNELIKYCANQGTTCLLDFYSDGLKLGSADVDIQNKIKLNSTYTIFKQYRIEPYIIYGLVDKFTKLNSIDIRHDSSFEQ